MVRGEALRDALVPVHRWVSTCDGSRELSHGPCVWVVNVKSLFYGFITTSLFYSADIYGDFLYNVIVMYLFCLKMFNSIMHSLLILLRMAWCILALLYKIVCCIVYIKMRL